MNDLLNLAMKAHGGLERSAPTQFIEPAQRQQKGETET